MCSHYFLNHPRSYRLPIPMALYYLLYAPYLSKWYSTIFYWPIAYTYGTLLSSTGSLSIPMVLYYFLLAPCLYLWYSTFFFWFPAYPYGTFLHSTGPLTSILYSTTFYWPTACIYGTLLPSTGSQLIPIVLYYLLLAPFLSLWYFIIFYCPTA